ncbi:MAG: FIST C-terminal domain-containing protein, partial [Gammaproteobacteria bacterium]|nr:FIST C-terminal domain-containing protein [Gammaproteobacteria bacterium]
FPLMVRASDSEEIGLVRTVLGIDEGQKSMTFAGDLPQGHKAQLMRANFERLIDGAGEAARIAGARGLTGRKLAVLISCVGRKMVLGQRTAEEVEAVAELLGNQVAQLGYYSYGEISPHVRLGSCELHNQTMTITVLSENSD